MSTGAILRIKKLTGQGIVRVAAAHNKRAIQAERRLGGSIDPRRSGLNECLAGPANPEDVADRARVKMAAAGVGKLRKDAVRALEVVVSLAPGQCADERAFLTEAMRWLALRFGGEENLLSADLHRDEGSPHLHVLLLPLIGGRMRGSEAVGGPPKLRQLQSDFYEAVCAPHGMTRYPRCLRGAAKASVVDAVRAELIHRIDPVQCSVVWQAVRDQIEVDPRPFAAALGLDMPADHGSRRLRTMAAIFTSKGKGSSKPDFEPSPRGSGTRSLDETYALYGLRGAPPTASSSVTCVPPRATSSP